MNETNLWSVCLCVTLRFRPLPLSVSDELSSLDMNSRLLKLSLPVARSFSFSLPPPDFLVLFSSFFPPFFFLSLQKWNVGETVSNSQLLHAKIIFWTIWWWINELSIQSEAQEKVVDILSTFLSCPRSLRRSPCTLSSLDHTLSLLPLLLLPTPDGKTRYQFQFKVRLNEKQHLKH